MIRFLQINLNHCWAAQQILQQTIAELGIDIVLVSDQLRNPADNARWIPSTDNKCAVSAVSSSVPFFDSSGAGRGFAWIKLRAVVIYSCYYSPTCSLPEYEDFLDQLDSSLRTHSDSSIIIGGDFNAHSPEWGCPSSDNRGTLLTNLVASHSMLVYNQGTSPTYSRVNAESIVDVTFARLNPGGSISDWQVLSELGSESDHSYLSFTFLPVPSSDIHRPLRSRGWSVKKLDPASLSKEIDILPQRLSTSQRANVDDMADTVQGMLTRLCDSSMSRRSTFRGRKAAHW